jgi:hypothetical protein
MHQLINQAIINLGYTGGWILRGDTYEGIEWVEQPDNIPSKEDIDNAIANIQAEQDAKAAAKESALTKLQALGLTEEEIKALIGGI